MCSLARARCFPERWRCAGGFAAKRLTEEQRFDIVRNACPGAGACGGMYTANTMSSAIEALGMSLPYSSSVPAEDPLKVLECRNAGRCRPLACSSRPRRLVVVAAAALRRAPAICRPSCMLRVVHVRWVDLLQRATTR